MQSTPAINLNITLTLNLTIIDGDH